MIQRIGDTKMKHNHNKRIRTYRPTPIDKRYQNGDCDIISKRLQSHITSRVGTTSDPKIEKDD